MNHNRIKYKRVCSHLKYSPWNFPLPPYTITPLHHNTFVCKKRATTKIFIYLKKKEFGSQYC